MNDTKRTLAVALNAQSQRAHMAVLEAALADRAAQIAALQSQVQELSTEFCAKVERAATLEGERNALQARIAELEGETIEPRTLLLAKVLEMHRRWHGKSGCPGDECYVCKAEGELEAHDNAR